MNKQKQKEQLSLRIAKTALVIAVITGLGTIIFGGGVVIMKYYKTSNNQPNNKIWNAIHKCSEEHPEFCDRSCLVDGDCIASCTYNMGCIRSGEGQVGTKAIRCEIAPFSCKCENNKCKIVEYEYKVKLLQSAKILGISLPIEIKEIIYYRDGGTVGVVAKDVNNKDFIFCLDGRIQIKTAKEGLEQRYIYIGATHPTHPNAQKIPIIGEKEKAILYILKDWTNRQVFKEEQTKLLDTNTITDLSEKELKIYQILKVIKELENRNQIDSQPDTSDWQTYRNEELGFEMKYPENFTKQKITSDDSLLYLKRNKNGSDILVSLSLKKNYQISKIVSIIEAEEIKIADRTGYKYFYQEGVGYSGVVLIQLDQDALELTYDIIGSYENSKISKKAFVESNIDQILSSFKFIEN